MDLALLRNMTRRELVASPALVARLNEQSAPYGLSLTMDGLRTLATRREEALANTGRVEFGEGVLPKLAEAFSSSPYLFQEDYAEALARLQAMFYRCKSEAQERIPDDALLAAMREAFDGLAGGSLDYLEETVLSELARVARGCAALVADAGYAVDGGIRELGNAFAQFGHGAAHF
jgi:hypothetical protein